MMHEMIRAVSPRPYARPHACISAAMGVTLFLDREANCFHVGNVLLAASQGVVGCIAKYGQYLFFL